MALLAGSKGKLTTARSGVEEPLEIPVPSKTGTFLFFDFKKKSKRT
jgi:hypothetical protein